MTRPTCLYEVPGGAAVCRCAKCLVARGVDLAEAFEDLRQRFYDKGEELYAAYQKVDELEHQLGFTDPQLKELARLRFETQKEIETRTLQVKRDAGQRASWAYSRMHAEQMRTKSLRGRINEAIHLLKHSNKDDMPFRVLKILHEVRQVLRGATP